MKKNRAVVCYYQEKYGQILDIVLKRHNQYAKKCKADFVEVIIPPTSTDPQMDKFFHISEKLDGYKKYLIIDVDILIRKDSPDIFSMVPNDHVAIYNEGATFLTTKNHEPDEIAIRWYTVNKLMEVCNLEKCEYSKIYAIGIPFVYYNSGVVLLSDENKKLYQGFTSQQKIELYSCFKDVQCSEQALVNYCLISKKSKVYSLPVCFNQMSYNRCSDYLETCYFSHYAGMSLEDKTFQIEKDHAIWESKGI